MSMHIIINPGTGPVDGADEGHAIENIQHFITDCGQKGRGITGLHWARVPDADEEGRYGFLLWWDPCHPRRGHCHLVQMPGLPLTQVRWMDEPGQNILQFPRLYVDGSSWTWRYALLNEEDFSCEEDM